MSKQQLYGAEAERMYVIDQLTIAEIASRLRANEKTIRSWKDAGDWEIKRGAYLKSKQSFHEELYEFGRLLLKKIREDMANNIPVDANRLYTLTRIIPQLIKVKDYEQIAKQRDNESGKEPGSADLVKTVEDALKQLS
ncbi:MAG: hypothetical protein RDU76_11515 [Candidatus Edwardsbacteria bacterium]|nr:hypothetical protein [Candidatus Edwardsbacteria bacterium]